MFRHSVHRFLCLAVLTCIALSACGSGGSGGRDRDAQPVLTSISISPIELTLEALGATAQLEATARDQNGSTRSAQFTWGSSDTVVATVDANGLVTALNNGTTTVTVRSGAVSASTTITVEQTPVSITLSSDEVVLTALGSAQQLQANVFDANDRAMAAEVTWESSDPSVATVDEEGRITAHANGTATVTATTASISGSLDVIVRQPLSVSGNPNVSDSRTGRSPLHVAAMANTPKLITALAAAGADVEARDKDGLTALHAAAATDSLAVIEALLEAGVDLEARDHNGQTPLQSAVLEKAAAATAALLEAGAELNVRDEIGRSLLHRAAWSAGTISQPQGAMATLVTLLEAGADPNARDSSGNTPLHVAAAATGPAVSAALAALLAAGADPNARDDKGWTPLRDRVALGDDPAVMAVLLEAGADIETRDNDGDSLLHLAAERDKPATIMALLEAGADLNARNNDGGSPLHVAAGSTAAGRPVAAAAAIAVLLDAGADPNARDDSGKTAVHWAPSGSRGLLTALLDAHAGRMVNDPNATDAFGYTALHAAARANSLRLIAGLLEAGAKVDALDDDDHTPLLLAAGATRSRGKNVPPPTYNPAALTMLAAAGADMEARIRHRQTALLQAANWGETAAIEALVAAGANLEARTINGRTALQSALIRGHTAAIMALAEAEAGREGGDYKDFAAVLALAVDNPAALAEAGLDPNARDESGRTVLHWAWAWADSAGLAALVAAGADVNARDSGDRTPLYWAAAERSAATISALAKAGADLNAQGYYGTALHMAVHTGSPATVAAMAATGANLEARDRNGWTALQLAAHRGESAMIAVLLEAGADLEARDDAGRTALQIAANRDYRALWIGGPSTPTALAALLEALANLNTLDNDGNTALLAAAAAGNQAATGILLALGARWTSDPDADSPELNARFVAMELFQGPMVWQWELAEPQAAAAGSGMREEDSVDHAKTLLHRATTVAVRIGSESPDPMPELSVSLSDADGISWATEAVLVHDPRIVSVPSHSESGLWETEYVYELPADWADSDHRAGFAIDPYNRLEETDESDNAATLTMDGYTVPVFDITFVPIVFSGDPPAIDTDTLMAVIGDLVPIGEHRARIGRLLDLSDRNLGGFDTSLSKSTALRELLHRWNAEAREDEYYHGLLSSDEPIVFGFGGQAYKPGNVAVGDAIYARCQVEHEFCGHGVHAHELGHNFDLAHVPGGCSETEPIDNEYPYPNGRLGPHRGWVSSRNEFVSAGDEDQHYDLMGFCSPRFVSDYHYNKMVDHRLGNGQSPLDDSERIGPSLEIGPVPDVATSATTLGAQTPAYAPPPEAAAATAGSGPGVALTDAIEEIGPSLAFAGAVDEYGLWSIGQIDASAQPPRSPGTVGEYIFTLQDAYQREIYREPMTLLTPVHGEVHRAWALRVPVPERAAAFLAILDAQGTPLFIQPIDVPLDILPVD